MCPFLAQAVRFELTCLYGKLISSQPRYDHFDTLAYLIVIYYNLIRNKEKWLEKQSFANPLRMQGRIKCELAHRRWTEAQTKGLLRLRIKLYLVRLGENPLDFPLDKVLKTERQDSMKPDGKRVCQNAVSDISARFRVTPLKPLE